VKLFVAEPGWRDVQALWEGGGLLACSWVGYAEVRSALAAASRAGRMSARRLDAALDELEGRWSSLATIEVDEMIARGAGLLAGRHALRALDAIHLASALRLEDPELVVVSWDERLRRAALDEGIAVAPA